MARGPGRRTYQSMQRALLRYRWLLLACWRRHLTLLHLHAAGSATEVARQCLQHFALPLGLRCRRGTRLLQLLRRLLLLPLAMIEIRDHDATRHHMRCHSN